MKITIEIDAVPQGRPRFYRGVAVDPLKSRKFKKELAEKVITLRGKSAIYEGELSIELHMYRNLKSTMSTRYGDIDNLVKGIFDALTGVVWKDDRQVTKLLVTKNLAEVPRIEITVEAVR